ncbi:p-type ATPase [Grosmannia clavigera kw1407]|uniref:Cation-transporting ATPase n=1 Tax=Grosmannia clavigera (strain kw1407 / UAMH 11150) TaxID=655863 RepID=F0XM34_GROCL|nr:p-type ATPase [Grosmannia clavigera kw1407]EFX01083.1 p-type ATPase [Grosmannia clavigera kw1407]
MHAEDGDFRELETRSERNGPPGLYRLDSNQSSASVFEDVEMANDQLYSGPMAESLPSSIAAFSHRRSRADSTTSFAYYTDDDEERDRIRHPAAADNEDDDVSVFEEAEGLLVGSYVSYDHRGVRYHQDREDDEAYRDEDDERHGRDDESEGEEDETEEMDRASAENVGLLHRRSSTHSRASVHSNLLRRRNSMTTEGGSEYGGGRVSQKTYIVTEDLYLVIAGFQTSRRGQTAYMALCVASLGLAWLLFRWLPRWHVWMVGRACELRECTWVVVENQWNEMAILNVRSTPYGRPQSTVFGAATYAAQARKLASFRAGNDYDDEADPDPDPLLQQLRVLDYRYVRFFYHPQRDKFVVSSGWKDPSWQDVRKIQTGIDGDEKNLREVVFGSNLIDIAQKSTMQLLVDEVFHPFYVFQIASLVLWSLDEYYYYAVAIFLMSFGSITTTLVETKATMRRLRDVSRFECDVRVLRNGFWRTIVSGDLVPGDVYELSDPGLSQLPSDSLLLSGDCIVNESMLTGESVPVSKTPMTATVLQTLDLAAPTVQPETARHFLFCGTKIIRARRPQRDAGARDGTRDLTNGIGNGNGTEDEDAAVALALVVRTGFNTTKGALVRSMLFPKPSGFKFYRDSFRYIAVMGGIALLGFVASFANFVRLGLAWHLILVRALDLITIVVPPALPATLTIGTNFALSRLRARQIFCISPQRVNVGGKLDLMCFDKTGTLTEDGLDVLGVRVVDRKANRFGSLITDAAALVPAHQPMGGPGDVGGTGDDESRRAALFTMATCHSLRSVDDELMGDPLDLKMFAFTGWAFEEGTGGGGGGGGVELREQGGNNDEDQQQGGLAPSVARPPAEWVYDLDTRPPARQNSASRTKTPFELGVVRSFEFASQLRRASVIVRAFGQKSGDVYVKGAPECMREICRAESLPADYDELLASYTHKGYRVIGCAAKNLPRLSWVRAQKMARHEAEAGLDFVGFIVFENKLKPTTTAVLDELREADIGTVMVTGDNILTAISVARECRLVSRTAHCFVPRFVQGHAQDPNAELQWESIDDSIYRLDPRTLLPLPAPPAGDASLPYAISDLRNYSVAVSGDVFRWIVDFAPEEVLKRMLVVGKIYARMSPDEKHELVEKLQSIDYCCGFCGDGANDCGALKAADVGISLSEAEASVAAPFTSRVFDICCVPEVIREGRAALVTSFSCFKYMSIYSAIQFTSVSFLYASASNLGDFQFLFIDLALILPIAVFMSWAGPFPELGKKRPTADLVSRKVLTPLLGLMAISVVIQTIAFVTVRQQPWFVPPVVDPDKSNIKNSENTALFLVSCFEYIFSGVVLNAGPPFRQSLWRNWPFVATIAVTLAATGYMVVNPVHWVKKAMQLTKISWSFKLVVLGLGLAYLFAAKIADVWVLPAAARLVGRAKLALTGHPKKRKEYKLILERMRT